MFWSRRPRRLRSVGSISSVFALLVCAIAAASSAAAREIESAAPAPAAPAADASPAAAPAAAEDALRDALWRFERLLRRRLAAADGAPPAAAAPDLDRMRRHLQGLRAAARRLEGAEGGELERKALALRPLLLDLERAATGAHRGSSSPWNPVAVGQAAPLAAVGNSACSGAAQVGDGLWRASVGPAGGGPSELWLRYAASASGWAAVTTAGSDLDTVVEVFASCPAAGDSPLARGDDEIGLQARAAFRVAAGDSRWIRIGGWRGAAGSLVVGLGGGLTGIAGTVTEEATGDPVASASIAIWDQSGFFEDSAPTDALGRYVVAGLAAGTYFVSTELFSAGDLLDELYDDIPCPGGAFDDGCDPTDGTPVVVVSGSITPDVDFALGPGGAIAGRVRDAGTGEAVPFANVQVFDSTGGFRGNHFADVAGRYRVGGLGGGSVFAMAREGQGLYTPELYDGVPCPDFCEPTTGTPIPVTVGSVTGGIDFDLDRRGGVAGRLTRAGGAPVPFESVEIFDGGGLLVGFGFTDSQGDYATGLDAGQYFVTTRTFDHLDELYDDLPCEPSCDPTTGTPVPVPAGGITAGIDFELQRLGWITGLVTDAGTLEVLFATVSAYDTAGNFVASGSNGFGGPYVIPGLAGGTYFVTASAFEHRDELYDDLPCPGGVPAGCDPTTGTPVSVQIDAVTSGIDFALDRLGGVSGTVTDAVSGDPLRFEPLQLFDSGGQLVTTGSTDSLGEYRFSGLEPGGYFVVALAGDYFAELYDDLPCPGGVPAGCDPTTGTVVPVTLGGPITGIDFALSPKGAIQGTVTEAGTGLPAFFASIAVWDSAGNFARSGGTDQLGDYRVPGLDAGTYFVTVTSPDHLGELYDDLPCPGGAPVGCDPTTGTAVAVTAGGTTPGVDFAIVRQGSLSGRVTEAGSGLPLFGGVVILFDVGGSSFDSAPILAPDGGYRFGSVPAGTWFVAVSASPDHADELYDDIPCPGLACDPTTGTPVVVSNAVETSGIDFALDVARGIVGMVTDDFGSPLVGVAVDLWDPSGDRIGGASTGITGFYRMTPDPGTYFVSTDNGQGLTDELFDDVPCPLGPAFEGLCDPLAGDAVVLPSFDALVSDVDFQLTGSPVIFADGFESGETTAWSATAP
jgi:protocatechuate 3,4-dioxygenase beta subunit